VGGSVLYVVRVASVAMDDLEIALLVSLYVVLVQALLESSPSYEVPDSVMVESVFADTTALTDVQIALSAAALHDHRLQSGLICRDDELRYWVKPRSTVWFGEFLMYAYDDSRWLSQF
jgi:hypothetical protein